MTRRIADRIAGVIAGVHRDSDDDLDGLIAWLRDPQREARTAAPQRREGVIG